MFLILSSIDLYIDDQVTCHLDICVQEWMIPDDQVKTLTLTHRCIHVALLLQLHWEMRKTTISLGKGNCVGQLQVLPIVCTIVQQVQQPQGGLGRSIIPMSRDDDLIA